MLGSNCNSELFYSFNPSAPLKICKLLGQIVGKAIFESIPIDPKLSSFVLKCMLSQEFELSDLENVDSGVYRSMKYLSTNSIGADSDITFSINDPQLGHIELITDGTSVKLNDENKSVFFELMLEYYGYLRCQDQIKAFLKGLNQVIPRKVLNILEIDDLTKLMWGTTTIDISDWKQHTNYTGRTSDDQHETIKWFWEIIETLTQPQLKKFLQFWTGCRSVPLDGFKALSNNRKDEWLFTINLIDLPHTFIRAHACFNRIDMPLYKSKSDLSKSIDYILSQKEFKFDFE